MEKKKKKNKKDKLLGRKVNPELNKIYLKEIIEFDKTNNDVLIKDISNTNLKIK